MSDEGRTAPGPPLPPSPLTEPPPPPFREVALPWNTLALTGLVDLVFGGLAQEALLLASAGSGAWAVVFALLAVLPGVLLGLGPAIVDRLRPHWPRAARWALGMGLRGLVPLSSAWMLLTLALGGQSLAWAHLPWLALQVSASVVNSACLGLLLGLAADRPKGLYGRLFSVGGFAGVGAAIGGVALAELGISLLPFGTPELNALGADAAIARCLSEPLIGLALANRLTSALRAQGVME